MDFAQIKEQAYNILKNQAAECSYYIEYKASAGQLDKILKTICAYGNNYYDNDINYLSNVYKAVFFSEGGFYHEN